MDSMKSSYSSSYVSGLSSGYGGYGSSSFSGGSTGGYAAQTKKNVIIKTIETKDGKVVSETSDFIED